MKIIEHVITGNTMKGGEKSMSDLRNDMIIYRAKERISQAELGKRCGLTGQTIMNIENGKANISKLTYAKIRLVVKSQEKS